MAERFKVLVTRTLPQEAIDRLAERCEVDVREGYVDMTRDELIARAQGADALCAYSDLLDDAVFDALPGLKVVATHWARADGPLVASATAHGVMVTTPPEQYRWVVTGVAELVWGLFIAAGRRFGQADAFTRAGSMDHPEASTVRLLGEGLAGRVLGLIGAGAIGTAVARRAAGFEMDIVYADPVPNPAIDALGGVRVDLDDLLRRADFVSLSVPPIEQNRRLIAERELRLMKPSAVFVNTARGMSVDEAALARALREGWIFAAGLDVYEEEPLVHPDLIELDNVILMPHTGGSLREERIRAALAMADSIVDAADGRVPRNLLNPQARAIGVTP